MYKHIISILALTFAMNISNAMPKPSEVKAAFAGGDYARAEAMLKEVLAEHPTAAVHYQLGQVYAKEGKHAMALNEFRQAQALDPTLKFASSANAFTKVLADEQTIVAPPPVNVHTVPMQQVTPVVSHADIGSVGAVLAIVFGGAALLATLYFATIWYSRRKEKQDVADALVTENKEKISTLLDFSKRIEDAILIAKSSILNVKSREFIVGKLYTYQTSVRLMLADAKDGKSVSSTRIATLEASIDDTIESVTNTLPNTDEPAYTPKSTTRNSQTKSWPTSNNTDEYVAPKRTRSTKTKQYNTQSTPAPIQRTVHGYHTSPAPATTTTVVNNSNDGLLTGLLIGNMLNNHTDRTVYVEHVHEHERPVIDTPQYERNTYQESRRSSTLDTSNEDDNYSAPSRSADIDSSSTSSDSYSSDSSSSMDSGSSDSSSSDSY